MVSMSQTTFGSCSTVTPSDDLKKRLETLKKAQKENESSVMRAEIAREEAKKRVVESAKNLKTLGYSSVSEAEAKIKELEQEIEKNISEAADILEIEV